MLKITAHPIVRIHYIIVLVFVSLAGGAVTWWHFNRPATTPIAISSQPKTNQATPPNSLTFNKSQYSLTDPTSPWVVVNKLNHLTPADYAPADLAAPDIPTRISASNPEMQIRAEAATALKHLGADAASAGYNLLLSSGYRSYVIQMSVYNGYIASRGQTAADTDSARPGHSEHQTGWAADLGVTDGACLLQQCFGNLPAGKWLAASAYKYGFILRYQADKTAVTGYSYEPWHIRYVGAALAQEMHTQGISTLEEFFGLPAAPDYN
jgi:D-alanyl-D-alanine carboxypeptidase